MEVWDLLLITWFASSLATSVIGCFSSIGYVLVGFVRLGSIGPVDHVMSLARDVLPVRDFSDFEPTVGQSRASIGCSTIIAI